MMIFVNFPENKPPSYIVCETEERVMTCGRARAKFDGVKEPKTYAEVITMLRSLSPQVILVETIEDVDLVGNYSGPQKYTVRAMAASIESWILFGCP